jgi:hypothetical protein
MFKKPDVHSELHPKDVLSGYIETFLFLITPFSIYYSWYLKPKLVQPFKDP